MGNLELTIGNIFSELFEIDITKIDRCSNLRTDLKLDSINLVNLQVELEDAFDIQFNPLETDLAAVFESVDSIIHYFKAGRENG